jgi:hypothetical protein
MMKDDDDAEVQMMVKKDFGEDDDGEQEDGDGEQEDGDGEQEDGYY